MKFLPPKSPMLFFAMNLFSDIITVSKSGNCQISSLFEKILKDKGFKVESKSEFSEFNILTIPTTDDALVKYINSIESSCISVEKETKFKTQ